MSCRCTQVRFHSQTETHADPTQEKENHPLMKMCFEGSQFFLPGSLVGLLTSLAIFEDEIMGRTDMARARSSDHFVIPFVEQNFDDLLRGGTWVTKIVQ